jgi:hypothetical protein
MDQLRGQALNFQEGMAAKMLMDIPGKNGEHVKKKKKS